MPGDGGERLAAGTQLGSLGRDHLRNGRNDGIALLNVERDAGQGSTPLQLRPGTTRGESGQSWRGHDPTASGRCWSVPRTGAYAAWIEQNLVPGYKAIQGVHARLEPLAEADLIHWPKRGSGWPRLKRYADAAEG